MPHYPRHLAHFDYQGFYRYFLTFCCDTRAPHFADPAIVALVHAQILRASRRERFSLLAYCYMHDHVHLLAQGEHERANAKDFIAHAKRFAAWEFRRQTGRVLWQRYGYERVLRDDETTPTVVAYILNNPVRAGLVESPTAYPHWGSSLYTREHLMTFVQETTPWSGPT